MCPPWAATQSRPYEPIRVFVQSFVDGCFLTGAACGWQWGVFPLSA